MERSLRFPRLSPRVAAPRAAAPAVEGASNGFARGWWTRSSAASSTRVATAEEVPIDVTGTPSVEPLTRSSDARPLAAEDSPIAEFVRRSFALTSLRVFLPTALVMHLVALLAPPTWFFAAAETFLTVANTIAAAVVFAHVLDAIERRAGKRAPIRMLSILLSDIPAWHAYQGRGTVVEPGWIDVPLSSWFDTLALVMVTVPVLATIADVTGWFLRDRGSMSSRVVTIAGVCGATGLLTGMWLLLGFHTSEESRDFDLFVGVPAMAGVVIAAMCGVAMGAARKALPEIDVVKTPVTITPAEAMREQDSQYRILRPIGAGGMGQVFLAQRVGPHGFQRPVVLKRITPGSSEKPAAVERFLEEARIAASLQHPNVIAVHDLGRLDQGGWFLAMEYLAGLTLRDVAALLVHRRLLAPAEAILAMGEQACRGLAHAHTRGIVHRDVSPHNLMLTFEGVVKVLDFGVAKAKNEPSHDGTERPRRTVVTQAGALVGKLTYLSPEQFRGREASPAGDVFGLGVVLYELATGRHPYGRKQGQHPIAEEPGDLVPLSVARPDLPRALCAVIDEALAFDPWNRFKSAGDMERALALARNASAADLQHFDLGDWLKSLAPAHWDDISVDAPAIETATAPHAFQDGTQG